MEGSFEDSPIVIRTSRSFSLIGFILCAAFTGLGLAPVLLGKVPFRIGDHLESLTAGLFGLYFAWQLVSPSTLILAPEGLTWKNSFKARHWPWQDVRNFRVVHFGSVGCDLSDDRSVTSWLRGPNKTLTGSQGSFGFGWEGGAASVVSALNAARARWL